MRAAGIPYVCGYGLSECSPIVTASSIKDSKIGAVGQAIPEVSIKIAWPDPANGVGEILVKGPNVMSGYYKNEVETNKVFTDDGWFMTGDRGYLDEDGFLYIKGRSKNVIVGSSGENIYPEVIEEKLKESRYVEEALVYQLDNQLVARIYPDYSYIQSLETNKDESAIASDIVDILESVRQEVNTRLPTFSRIQKVIEQTSPFIKTPTKKIKRAEYVPGYLTTTIGYEA
jgi:long-chain acyl-CoA synthetase